MEISFQAKPISIKRAEYTKLQLLKSNFVDIVCHSSSDEDTIASARAIKWFLNKNKIPSRIISDSAAKTFNYKSGDTLDISSQKLPKVPSGTVLCVDFSEYTRVSSELKKYIEKAKNLICIDHHNGPEPILKGNNIYTDLSAKSCSGIILRFFEALKINPPEKIKQILYCGMSDDLKKNKFLEFTDRELFPAKTKEFMKDKNTKYLYSKLESELSAKDKIEVNKHLNILMSLNKPEKMFKDSLPEKIQYNSNGKFGYVIIPPNDEQWLSLGGDNKRTSAILRNFRLTALKNDSNLDSAAVFYPNSSGYRISIHSKGNNVLKIFEHIRGLFPEFSGGGHPERGGGGNSSLKPEDCNRWINSVISGIDDFYKNNCPG